MSLENIPEKTKTFEEICQEALETQQGLDKKAKGTFRTSYRLSGRAASYIGDGMTRRGYSPNKI